MRDRSSIRRATLLLSVTLSVVGACGDEPGPIYYPDTDHWPPQPDPGDRDAGSSTSASSATLHVDNRSRAAIYALRVSPSSSNDWGPNRLSSAAIGPGERRTLRVNACGQNYDLRAQTASGAVIQERRQVPIPCGYTVTWPVGG